MVLLRAGGPGRMATSVADVRLAVDPATVHSRPQRAGIHAYTLAGARRHSAASFNARPTRMMRARTGLPEDPIAAPIPSTLAPPTAATRTEDRGEPLNKRD
jgi:hypothetical protein